jgi:exosortase A-associated hydrolase 1
VGSHRQFVLLARALARAGIPVLRFDYRGIGDSTGAARDFEDIDADIRAAVDLLVAHTGVRRVVLWGLCDAAAAALMYAHDDARVTGLVLLNPWVHSPVTEARARLKTYYLRRLMSRDFWRKLARLELDLGDSLGSLLGYFREARAGGGTAPPRLHFIERMRTGWAKFGGPVLLILSGDDLTAEEFRELARQSPAWAALVAAPAVTRVELAEANHTFARGDWRERVERETLEWLERLARGDAP